MIKDNRAGASGIHPSMLLPSLYACTHFPVTILTPVQNSQITHRCSARPLWSQGREITTVHQVLGRCHSIPLRIRRQSVFTLPVSSSLRATDSLLQLPWVKNEALSLRSCRILPGQLHTYRYRLCLPFAPPFASFRNVTLSTDNQQSQGLNTTLPVETRCRETKNIIIPIRRSFPPSPNLTIPDCMRVFIIGFDSYATGNTATR